MTGPEGQPAVWIDEVSKRFSDGVLAVDALSLTVHHGEIACVIGGRGAGKSVLLRMVAGLLRPSYGRILVRGQPVVNRVKTLEQLAFVGSRTAHAHLLSAVENVEFYTTVSGVSCSRADCIQGLREAGLRESALHVAAGELGAEDHLLIWLATATLRRASVIVFDDPSAGLEPSAIKLLQAWCERRRSTGTAILLATADPVLASQSDKIMVLVAGRKVSEKTRQEFTAQSLMALYMESLGHQ